MKNIIKVMCMIVLMTMIVPNISVKASSSQPVTINATVSDNGQKVVDFIKRDGYLANNGNYVYTFPFNEGNASLVYEPSESHLTFLFNSVGNMNGTEYTLQNTISWNYKSAAAGTTTFFLKTSTNSYGGDAALDIPNYTTNTRITVFNSVLGTPYTLDDATANVVNNTLLIAMDKWEGLLYDKTDLTFKELGFSSFVHLYTPKTDENKEESNQEDNDQKDNNQKEIEDSKQKSTSFIKISAKKKSFVVAWKKQAKGGIKGYEIQYSTDKGFKKELTKVVTINKVKTTKTTIRKLKSKKKYYVRIRTFSKKNGVKVYSKWSKIKSVKVK